MAAAYDTFDYPSYWIGREYEHRSEVIALKAFLSKIKRIKTILEIGAGFGRLAPIYSYRAKRVILSDPSSKTLKVARNAFKDKKNFRFIHSSLENIPNKLRASSVDLIIMIRVLHHIKDVNQAFDIICRTLKPGGYLIFEFANKKNLKATMRNILKWNISFFGDKSTTDMRSLKSIRRGTIPFLNYHPEKIKSILDNFGFEVIEERSVSNIRSTFLKRIFSTDLLIFLERHMQTPFSFLDIGPSIFILAKKR